jgi:hypothetical protein
VSELLEEYDRQLRRTSPYFDPEVKLEREGSVVRLIGSQPAVLYAGPDASIDRELERFSGRTFEWKWHSHDKPEGLKERLLEKGFTPKPQEAVMAAEVPSWIHAPAHDVRRLERGEKLLPVFEVQRAIWPEYRWLEPSLEREWLAKPDFIRFYVAYNLDRPVGACWMRFNGDFAALYGGSVLPEARGRGYYKAMVTARLLDARGAARWAVCDAGPMSEPILGKMGFNKLADTVPMMSPVKK